MIINGLPTAFFKVHRGLRQGCDLSPIVFILIMETLSRKIMDFMDKGLIMGLNMTRQINVTHLIFVDDLLLDGESYITE